jgi:uncharacterized protein YycO
VIVGFKGISRISRFIRFFNWGDYSHVAWVDNETMECIESWAPCGVRMVPTIHHQHTPGTPVDIFSVQTTDEQEKAVREFLLSQVGKAYDWPGIASFVTRRKSGEDPAEKWFCSELIMAAYQSIGVNLLERIPAYKVSPSMLVTSHALELIDSGVTRYVNTKEEQQQ